MNIASSPELAVLQPDWDFSPTRAAPRVLLLRHIEQLRGRIAAPRHEILVPPKSAGAWIVYFVYIPDGRLDPAHCFALGRLRALGRRLLVVCTTSAPAAIPAELAAMADALVWKAQPGFDFSAYAVGLRTLADHCPGSDALVLNDSTFGPLIDLQPWLDRMPWDLGGFTASSNVENHIQSYAFHLRGITPQRLDRLASVLPRRHAYDRFWAAVLWQETRLARVAAQSMTVGALYHADVAVVEDPTWQLALPLAQAGFPFLKRSLLGKLSDRAPRDAVLATLEAAGYPV